MYKCKQNKVILDILFYMIFKYICVIFFLYSIKMYYFVLWLYLDVKQLFYVNEYFYVIEYLYFFQYLFINVVDLCYMFFLYFFLY